MDRLEHAVAFQDASSHKSTAVAQLQPHSPDVSCSVSFSSLMW